MMLIFHSPQISPTWRLKPVYVATLLLGISICILPGTSQAGEQPPATYMLILDASGSMWGQIDGTAKIVIAKQTMASLIADLPDNATVGLMLYGHRRKGDCNDVEQVAALAPLDRAALRGQVELINPKGKTPITLALQQAVASLGKVTGECTVLLVSDGKETCDADPCAATRVLKESGVGFVLHVIGFDVAGDERAQLECIADAGGGKYFNVTKADDLVLAAQTATNTLAEAPASGDGRVWLEQSVVISGGELTAHFEAAASFHANAWIGIVPATVEHGSEAVNDAHDVGYVYLNRRTSGTVTLTAPASPGAYDVRMHDSDSNGREVASVGLEVQAAKGRVWLERTSFTSGEEMVIHFSSPGPLPDSAWLGIVPADLPHGSEEVNDNHDVGYRHVSGQSSGSITINAPSQPGRWDARLNDSDNNGAEVAYVSFTVSTAEGRLRLDQNQVAPGAPLVVHFTVPEGLPSDAWAGIVPSEIPHGDESTNDDNDLGYRYLGGESSGMLELTAPEKPGSYDIRLHDTDNSGNEIASVSFTVE